MTSRRRNLDVRPWRLAFALLFAAGAAGCGLSTQGIPGNEGSGGAAQKCAAADQCDDGDPCTIDTCSADGLCKHAAMDDGPLPDDAQVAGDCKTVRCDRGATVEQEDDADVPSDHEDCTEDACSAGTPVHKKKGDGTACTDMFGLAGECDFGTCKVRCSDAMPCPAAGPCAAVACNVATGTCVVTPLPDGAPTPGVADTAGDCHAHICKAGVDFNKVDDSDVPVTQTDCDFEVCNNGAPSTPPKVLDNPCSTAPSGAGFCDGAGSCVECNTDDQCSGAADECKHPACNGHACGTAFTQNGTLLVNGQTAGDCKQLACDGAGSVKSVTDDNDKPIDGNLCTGDVCSSGAPSNPITPGVSCGGIQVCTAQGLCGCNDSSNCAFPNTCGGGGIQGACGCTPVGCAAQGKTCGTTDDQCFNPTLACDTGTKNGQETDTDCGGPASACPTRCAQGKACNVTADCAAGLTCADGVCCNTTCTGACQACSAAKKGQGLDGVCGAIKQGTDPDSECAQGAVSSCGLDGLCDGAGACEKYAPGTVCVQPSCAAGVQTTAGTCDASATCQGSTMGSCGLYACGPVACNASCSSDAQCASGSYCGGSACAAKKANGVMCGAPHECTSGFCFDGVCCNADCSGTCVACTAAKKGTGSDGACGNVAQKADPDGECGAYTCNAASCYTSCNTNQGDGHCDSASYCAAGNVCQTKLIIGGSCTAAYQCASGFCVDGVCCNALCNVFCGACTAAKKGAGSDGACGFIAAGTDPDNECGAPNPNCNGNGGCQ